MENCPEASVICPACQSEHVVRIHRRRIEKLVTSKCKYQCTDCGDVFFIQNPELFQKVEIPQPPSEKFFHFFRS